MLSISLAVLWVGGIVEYAQVACVARLAYEAIVHGLQHGAPRLVGVGAIVVAAAGRGAEYLGKVVRHLALVEVDGAETLYSRGVDEVSAAWQREHFGKCGGVHACVVRCAYVPHLQPGTWN